MLVKSSLLGENVTDCINRQLRAFGIQVIVVHVIGMGVAYQAHLFLTENIVQRDQSYFILLAV